MRAMVVPKAGREASLVLRNLPKKEPSPHEVRLKVHACAVAYRDILDKTGAFPMSKQDAVLGHEFAGTVEACGAEVENLRIGDKVASLHWAQDLAWPSPLSGNTQFLGITHDGG